MNESAILKKLKSMAETVGVFKRVCGYEPRGQPGNGLTLSLISGPLTTVGSSGLASASLRWQVDGMVYLPMNKDPPENIDILLTAAARKYLVVLCADFTLGGLVRCIDVHGWEGEKLNATPGYIDANDKLYRVCRLTIPLLINNVLALEP
jgi:hypothetical protein